MDSNQLTRQFGQEAVGKARRATRSILDKMTDPTLVRQRDVLASPSALWQHLEKPYADPQPTEKARLEHQWQTLRMADGEVPLTFLSRARYIRQQREQLGANLKDEEANRHIARCLSSEYDFERRSSLSETRITNEMMEEKLENAYAEMTIV